jgi:hypothetical protein
MGVWRLGKGSRVLKRLAGRCAMLDFDQTLPERRGPHRFPTVSPAVAPYGMPGLA